MHLALCRSSASSMVLQMPRVSMRMQTRARTPSKAGMAGKNMAPIAPRAGSLKPENHRQWVVMVVQ